MSEFKNSDVGKIFDWNQVSRVHRSRSGIYQKNGILVSLLTDLGKISRCYPDIEADDGNTLFYTGAGRRGNQKLDVYNQALSNAMRAGIAVPLFCKLDVNQWEYKGLWNVTEAEYVDDESTKRKVWRFVLRIG